ncbi:MAG: glycoside hydrolase [Alphaproteobacteria bacterium CG_4_10_14_0_2_um_filter_63_37]|nr:MAG: glycoside hydrolase [Alphaproteobacteria bacterium CG_4_10_14_0_2_um_filter_63_37]
MSLVPEQALDLAISFEGFARVVQRSPVVLARPYRCPAGHWTIGYGHLCRPDHPPIDEAQGQIYLEADMGDAVAQTLRVCPILTHESPQRLAAVADWTFNLGSGRLRASTMRRRINEADWREAANEMRRWVWGGGRKLPGLVLRREAEAALLLSV